jgi:thioredoxin 1
MPETALITVTDDTFADVVLGSRLPILVDFWAEWCPPCRVVEKTLAELAEELRGEVVIAKLNADDNPEATRKHRVMALPTLLLFRHGVVVSSTVGARPKSHLRRTITASTRAYVNG